MTHNTPHPERRAVSATLDALMDAEARASGVTAPEDLPHFKLGYLKALLVTEALRHPALRASLEQRLTDADTTNNA